MPSSPNGPCSTGKTTSAPSRPPPGVQRQLLAVVTPGAVALDRRPAATSWPAAREAVAHRGGASAATRRARTSARRRGRRPSWRRPSASVGVAGVGGGGREPPDDDRHAACPSARSSPPLRAPARATTPSSSGSSVARSDARATLKPASSSVVGRVVLGLGRPRPGRHLRRRLGDRRASTAEPFADRLAAPPGSARARCPDRLVATPAR